MALTEKRVLKSVEILHDRGLAQVAWADQILRDDEVISEVMHRKTYSVEDVDAFMAEVDGAANYLAALGWDA